MAVIVFLLFWDVLLGNHFLWGGVDFALQVYPLKKYAFDLVKQGIFPVWNPAILCGMPLAADPSLGLFYPLHVLFLIFSPLMAYHLFLIVQLFLAGVFMYIFLKELTQDSFASFFVASLYMLSNPFMKFFAVFEGRIWLPLLFYCATVGILKNSRRAFWGMSFVVGMQFLSGMADFVVYEVFALWLYVFFLVFFHPRRQGEGKFRLLSLTLLSVFLGAGIGSFQIFLSGSLIRDSILLHPELPALRVFKEMVDFTPQMILNYPDLFLDGGSRLGGLGAVGMVHPSYSDLLLLLFFFSSLRGERSRYVIFFFFLFIVSFVICFSGNTPLNALLDRIPFYKVFWRRNKALILVWFSLSALSAVGLSAYLQEKARQKKTIALVFAAVFLSAWFVRICKTISGTHGIYFIFGEGKNFFFVLWLTALAAIYYGSGKSSEKRFKMVLSGLLVLVFLLNPVWRAGERTDNYVFMVKRTKKLLSRAPEFVEMMKTTSELFRVYDFMVPGNELGLVRNLFMAYGIDNAGGYSFLRSYRHHRLLEKAGINTLSPEDILRNEKALHVLRLMNVRYILSSLGDVSASVLDFKRTRLSDAYPRAVFTSRHAVVSSPERALEMASSTRFDPSAAVILEEPFPARIFLLSSSAGAENVSWVTAQPGYNHLRVTSLSPGFLVLSETFYPGWRAFVDGKPARIYRANYLFQAVFLEQGTHVVTFKYFQPFLTEGLVLTVFFMCITSILLLRKK